MKEKNFYEEAKEKYPVHTVLKNKYMEALDLLEYDDHFNLWLKYTLDKDGTTVKEANLSTDGVIDLLRGTIHLSLLQGKEPDIGLVKSLNTIERAIDWSATLILFSNDY